MTRRDSLQALYDAVKAGTATNFRALVTDSDNPAERAKRCGWASSAYKGRLDAAHALHKAVLVGHFWDVWRTTTFDDDPRRYGCNLPGVDTEYADTPARAWLLAILAALIAQETPE